MHAHRLTALAGLAVLGLAAAVILGTGSSPGAVDAAPSAARLDASPVSAPTAPAPERSAAARLESPSPTSSRGAVEAPLTTPEEPSREGARDGGRTREQDRVLTRAAALAGRHGLSATEQEALAAVLLEEQERREVVMAALRVDPDSTSAGDRAREQLTVILAWKTEELRARFGPSIAGELMKRR